MIILTWIILTAAGLFTLINLIINSALIRSFRSGMPDGKKPVSFSVVVAARNERNNIVKLVSALSKQNYPQSCYEVILVDDNSEDCTYEAMLELIKGRNNFAAVRAKDKPYPAKKGALEVGIGNAEGAYIIITDADCEPEADWLISYSDKFNQGYDFLFGIYSFFNSGSLVNAITRFNSMRGAILTFSAAALGKPYSAGASSFAFRKEAFLKLGGYKNTLETLSGDDDLLLREAVKNKYKVGIVTAPGSVLHTASKETFREYLIQKARHTSTSRFYLPTHKIFLASWHLLNIIFLLSFFLYFIDPYLIYLFLLKILSDIITIKQQQKRFGCSFKFYEIFYLQVIYEVLLIVNFFNASKGKKLKWK